MIVNGINASVIHVTKAFISLTDFVYSSKKEEFFKELSSMNRNLETTPDWINSPIALGRTGEITLSEFPDTLDFSNVIGKEFCNTMS